MIMKLHSDRTNYNSRKMGIEMESIVDDKYVEILHWLSLGLSADEIAGKVYLSSIAVRARLQRLRKKFNCSNSSHLVAYAIWNNII
jgi:DNA-binding CsgD family transcriptional regulator